MVRYLQRTFVLLALLSVVLGIVKITVAAMMWSWSFDLKGFANIHYRAEISGATFSGFLDIAFSLFGLNAISRNNAMAMYIFSMNIGLVCLAKTAHVYLCYNHYNKFKSILKNEVETLWVKYNYLDESLAVTTRIQRQFECCGASDASSWARQGMKSLPRSCCSRDIERPICTMEDAFRKGCFQALLENVKYDWMKFLLCISVPILEVCMLVIGCVYIINEIRPADVF